MVLEGSNRTTLGRYGKVLGSTRFTCRPLRISQFSGFQELESEGNLCEDRNVLAEFEFEAFQERHGSSDSVPEGQKSPSEKKCSQSPWEDGRDRSDQVGMSAKEDTLASLLRLCGNEKVLSAGRLVHGHIFKSGHHTNTVLGNLLVRMYERCGALEDALDWFARLQERDLDSWNLILGSFVRHRSCKKAMELFCLMQEEGAMPNKVTFLSALSACSNQAALAEGRQLHTLMTWSGLETDIVVATALINMYGKCRKIADARRMFDKMSTKDTILWNAMIGVYAQHEFCKEALLLFEQMQLEGVISDKVTFISLFSVCSGQIALAQGKLMNARIANTWVELDIVVANTLANMYCKCGGLEYGRETFDRMAERDVVSWNAMIAGYSQCGHGKEALKLFREMQQQGMMPQQVTFVSVVSAFSTKTSLAEGKQMHLRIIQSGFELNVVVATSLVNMYSKIGSLNDALDTFDRLPNKDLVSWNAIITGYSQQGYCKESLWLFNQMQLEGVLPDQVTFACVLNAHASRPVLKGGKRMHCQIVSAGFDGDVVITTALIDMYGKCGSLEEAQGIFDHLFSRNVSAWNAVIAAYSQQGCGMEIFQLFGQMQQEQVIPDETTFSSILSVCAAGMDLIQGKHVHTCILLTGLESNIFVTTALINMYGKCGSLRDARKLFDKMLLRDVVSWNAMITMSAQNDCDEEALRLFDRMQQEREVPDEVTFASILSVHAKCGNLEAARRLFDTMMERHVGPWNAMISAQAQNGCDKEALLLFTQMQQEGVMPDEVTYVIIVSVCTSWAAVIEGKQILVSLSNFSLQLDVTMANALLTLYSKFGSLEDSERVFNRMLNRDVVSWNAMISAFARVGECSKAVRYFIQMQLEGAIPDEVTFLGILEAHASEAALAQGKRMHVCIMHQGYEADVVVATGLVDMYGKCSSLQDAQCVFDKMTDRNAVSWNAIISACSQNSNAKTGLQLFYQMQEEGNLPDSITFISTLSACAGETALAQGRMMHARIFHSEFNLDVVVMNVLINMYGRCGSLKDADSLFDKPFDWDVASWNAMIAAYAQHGHGKKALQFFDRMQHAGVIPDQFTFIALLSACSHSGLVNEGLHFLIEMARSHGITPTIEHYGCMIDLLGRTGQLDEAESLINHMPCEPTTVLWTSLLGACRKQVDVVRGERAAKRMIALDAKDASPYINLSNIYAAAGRCNDAKEVMKKMRGKRIQQVLA